MNFWKRLGAGLITLTLVLGLLPAVTIAVPTATVDAPKTGAKILYAGFRLNEAKLDGVLDEEEWSLSGKMSDGSKHYRFGMLYSTATLYMAYEVPAGNPSISVKIDGINARVSPVVNTKTGCAELAISLSDAGIRLSGFDASVSLSIKLGSMSWDGSVTFTSLRPDTITDDLGERVWNSNGAEMNYTGNTLNMHTTTYAGGEGYTNVNITRFSDVSDEMHTILQSIDSTNISLDFDIQINEMPAYAAHYAYADYYTTVANGLVLTWTGKRYTDVYTYDSANSGMVTGITNTVEDGLVLTIRDAEYEQYATVFDSTTRKISADAVEPKKIVLGKQLGEKFHLRMDYSSDEKILDIYVDSVFMGRLTDVTYGTAYGAQDSFNVYGMTMGLYLSASGNPYTTVEDSKVDLSVSNLRVGSYTTESTALNAISFDTIKADNYSMYSIYSDLFLPTFMPGLPSIKLKWTSNKPNVIAADGTVTPADRTTHVTLTVEVRGNEKVEPKSFSVFVPGKDPQINAAIAEDSLNGDGIKLDGKMDETCWGSFENFFAASSNLPSGSMSAAWDTGYLYFAVRSTNATGLWLRLNRREVYIDLSKCTATKDGIKIVKGDVWEIAIPIENFYIRLKDYDTPYPLKAELRNSAGSTPLDNVKAVGFNGVVYYPQRFYPWAGSNQIDSPASTERYALVSNAELTADVDRFYIGGVRHSLYYSGTATINVDYKFDNLPVSDGAVQRISFTEGTSIISQVAANGFYQMVGFQKVGVLDPQTATNGQLLFTVIYKPTEDSNLMLKLSRGVDVKGNPREEKSFDMGVKEGQAFRLTLIRNRDDSVEAYVDGRFIGKMEQACGDSTTDCLNAINFRYYNEDDRVGERLTFTAENITVAYPKYSSVTGDLKINDVIGYADLHDLRESITLPKKAGKYIIRSLQWVTSDDTVIDKQGNIKRTEKGQRDAVLTLKVGGNTVWSRKVILPALNIKDDPSAGNITAGYTTDSGDDAITIDGKITDEGWVMSGRVLDNNTQQLGEFGAQWNQQYLYLAVDTDRAYSLAVQVNGVAIPLTGDSSVISKKSGTIREYKIPLNYIGITEIASYDTLIPITVTLDRSSYIGNLNLTSVNWWKVFNSAYNQPLQSSSQSTIKMGSGDLAQQRAEFLVGNDAIESGVHLWDEYNPGGKNYLGTKNEAVMWQELGGFENMRNRDESIYLEFDFEARSMPAYEINDSLSGSMWGATVINYGFYMNVADTAVWERNDTERWSNVYMLGIINAGTDEDSNKDSSEREDGLYLNLGTDRNNVFRLNRYVGDTFRLGLAWHTDDSLTIYLDGEEFQHFDHCSAYLNYVLTEGVRFAVYRNDIAPVSADESIDVVITNLAFGSSLPQNPVDVLMFSDIAGANTEGAGNVVSDLVLPTVLSNGIFANSKITWTSSNPAVISHTGKVTRPESGVEKVTLTATDENGNKKVMDLTVLGINTNSVRVLVVDADTRAKNEGYGYSDQKGDLDPANTPAFKHDGTQFKLDYSQNSIVYNMRYKQPVNVVRLRDSDEYSRLTRESIQLWVSDDNKTYTEVKNFKLLQRGTDWYLYDFDVETVYVKVRYTHFDTEDSDFINTVDDMIEAYYEDVFGSNKGLFQSTTYTLKNNLGKDTRDQAFTIAKATLGIGNAPDNSLRFLLNGNYLFHYVDGSNVVVRIPDLKKDASVELTVLYGNEEAMDISNKEDVYEVTYGIRETTEALERTRMHQTITLKAGQKLANGTVLEQDRLVDCEGGHFEYSYDGGYTWLKGNDYPEDIRNVGILEQGGFIVDENAGRLFFVTRKFSNLKAVVLQSDDGGVNWRLNKLIDDDDPNFKGMVMTGWCNYTNGLSTSVYDGEGPNVDLLIMMTSGTTNGVPYPSGSSGMSVALFSKDAGKTWNWSFIPLNLPSELTYEGGVTEVDVLENDRGQLVAYCRYQTRQGNQMAYATSGSYGVTWSATKVSKVYNVNSQPTLERFFESETPVMLWSGNNGFSAASQQRMPVHVATSTDNLFTWRNIQNTFAETPLEDYVGIGIAGAVTNPTMNLFDGALISGWGSNSSSIGQILRVTDFENYLYRTKGAYDSFEHGTTLYEGWVPYAGYGNISSETSTDGKYSMKLSDSAILSRYIPYLQDGSVSFDLYIEPDSSISIDLQSAFTPRVGVVSPMSIAINDMILSVGDEIETGYKLREGWNSIKFTMELAGDGHSGRISINGDDPLDIPLSIDAGDYITYVCVRNETDGVFLDNFLVESELDAEIYARPTGNSGGGINAPTGDATNLPLLIVLTTLSLVALVTLAGKLVADRKRKTQ